MGLEIRLSHESYAAQDIDRVPLKHRGKSVNELEKRGIETDRSNENRAIEEINKGYSERKERKLQRRRERNRNRGR